jgi:hypothetical protein
LPVETDAGSCPSRLHPPYHVILSCPLLRLHRDSIIFALYEGTTQIQREIISRVRVYGWFVCHALGLS